MPLYAFKNGLSIGSQACLGGDAGINAGRELPVSAMPLPWQVGKYSLNGRWLLDILMAGIKSAEVNKLVLLNDYRTSMKAGAIKLRVLAQGRAVSGAILGTCSCAMNVLAVPSN